MNYDPSRFRSLGIGERIEENDIIKWSPDSLMEGREVRAAELCGSVVTDDDDFTALRPIEPVPTVRLGDGPNTEVAAYGAGQSELIPVDPTKRKNLPLATGVLDYFPLALLAMADLSRIGNEQHNPGKPLHWDRSKSGDEADALARHLLQRGTVDTDGVLHSVKCAWRACAMAQKEIEARAAK